MFRFNIIDAILTHSMPIHYVLNMNCHSRDIVYAYLAAIVFDSEIEEILA